MRRFIYLLTGIMVVVAAVTLNGCARPLSWRGKQNIMRADNIGGVMRLLQTLFVLTLMACGAVAYHQGHTTQPQQPPAPKPQTGPTTPTQINPNQEINNRYVKQFLEKIAGRENEAAEKVFKNIQIELFKRVPAARFLRIMNGGYSRALGVSCTYCHVEQDFTSDDKRPKRTAREMAVMHKMINDQLAKMENLELKPEERFINCSTCHRGAINPIAMER